ncbi:MAG: cytochrome c maturation protein CcmE [Alphaproteobacteria bacterium]|nr:cytochrome c maturation protein CcmE [Alphaproteobacteria bacterium]
MTRKRRRLYVVVAAMLCLGVATALMLAAFQDSIVFFRSPTDIAEKPLPPSQRFRLGGLVEEKSVRKTDGGTTTAFRVTDLSKSVEVTYRGILPDLFREGQGVIAEGKMGPDGVFVASEVLARHDENYMPKEVVEALKKSGQWNDAAPGKGHPAMQGAAKP